MPMNPMPDPTNAERQRRWRERQTVADYANGGYRPMRKSDAARKMGVSIQTWSEWEKPIRDPKFKMPSPANMRRIFELTGGQVTADMMHGLTEQEKAA